MSGFTPTRDPEKIELEKASNKASSLEHIDDNKDAEFGGTEARKKLEKRFLLKLDLRMSILILIYILNYVGARLYYLCLQISLQGRPPCRLTETMLRMLDALERGALPRTDLP